MRPTRRSVAPVLPLRSKRERARRAGVVHGGTGLLEILFVRDVLDEEVELDVIRERVPDAHIDHGARAICELERHGNKRLQRDGIVDRLRSGLIDPAAVLRAHSHRRSADERRCPVEEQLRRPRG